MADLVVTPSESSLKFPGPQASRRPALGEREHPGSRPPDYMRDPAAAADEYLRRCRWV